MFAAERFEEAVRCFEGATQFDANNSDAWAYLARTYANTGAPSNALAASARALAHNPDVALAWFAQGNALGSLKRHDEALAAYDRALALDPDDAKAWTNKGNALDTLW
ncbi:MAG TPA: tetratricopeptide repeat protein, partial [Ktedonobacterales bacterium]|nr:tetratricopeptide repeat protein [Ktedonobacterales bacterium]